MYAGSAVNSSVASVGMLSPDGILLAATEAVRSGVKPGEDAKESSLSI